MVDIEDVIRLIAEKLSQMSYEERVKYLKDIGFSFIDDNETDDTKE